MMAVQGSFFVLFTISNIFLCAGLRIEHVRSRPTCGTLYCYPEPEKLGLTRRNVVYMSIVLYHNKNEWMVQLTSFQNRNLNRDFPRYISAYVAGENPCRDAFFACSMEYWEGSMDNRTIIKVIHTAHIAPDRPTAFLILSVLSTLEEFVLWVASKVDTTIPHLQDEEEILTTMMKVIKPDDCQRGMPYYSAREIVGLDGEDHLCDTETDGGGWIVVQARSGGGESFDRTWMDYRLGFGGLYGDFWRGLQFLTEFTNKDRYEFRVDVWYNGVHYYANYESIKVFDSSSQYRLQLGVYMDGNWDFMHAAGKNDRFNYYYMRFTTKDSDNDNNDAANCASGGRGGFWYNNCGSFYPNANWTAGTCGVTYGAYTDCALKIDRVELKIRKRAPHRSIVSGQLVSVW